jgi:hypothetical protein
MKTWKQLKRRWPEFAAVVEAKILAAMPGPGEGATQCPDEIKKVTKAYPNWRKTVRTELFHYWLQAQPYEIRRLRYSERADDAIQLLRKFETRPR